MSESFQNEIPRARVNIKLDLVTGGVQKKVELPLKLLSVGDYIIHYDSWFERATA